MFQPGFKGSLTEGNDSFTKALLHFENDYTDSAAGATGSHTWTPQNSPPGFSASAKFGSAAFSSQASHPLAPATPARYLESAASTDFNLGGSDFTIDFWPNTSGHRSGQTIAQCAGTGEAWQFSFGSNGLFFWGSKDGSSYGLLVGLPTGWSDNTYTHVALVRNGNTYTAYKNGVGGTPVISSGALHNPTSNTIRLGWDITALIDEFRLSVGVARWTADFTPPTRAYF